jgi:hypothetical protein
MLSSAHFSSPLWGEDEGEGEIKTLTLNPHPIPLPLKKGEGMTKHSEKLQNSSYMIQKLKPLKVQEILREKRI